MPALGSNPAWPAHGTQNGTTQLASHRYAGRTATDHEAGAGSAGALLLVDGPSSFVYHGMSGNAGYEGGLR